MNILTTFIGGAIDRLLLWLLVLGAVVVIGVFLVLSIHYLGCQTAIGLQSAFKFSALSPACPPPVFDIGQFLRSMMAR